MNTVTRKIVVNGTEQAIEVLPEMRLLDWLREVAKLTGTKEGCGEGECGACSILRNGEVVNSCLLLVGQLADGDAIVTIEGIARDREPGLHPIQQAFIDCGATQCGICTPGMVIAAYALLAKNAAPTREEIVQAIAGNLCRCTGYVKIVDAIERAASILRGEGR
jgi:aerobic carbon-monoxide dehydrogenase small subunit